MTRMAYTFIILSLTLTVSVFAADTTGSKSYPDKPPEISPLQSQGPVLPEATTPIWLSAKDVNRVACQAPIKDLAFSSEKDVEAHFSGKNVFIKFKVKKKGKELFYANKPVEFFISCDDAIYTIIGHPRGDLQAVTLRLQSPKSEQMGENMALFGGRPMVNNALKLIQDLYSGDIRSSYDELPSSRVIDIRPLLHVKEIRRIEVPGEGLVAMELEVRGIFENAATGTISIRESEFLTTRVAKNILAISVVDQDLSPGQKSRVFVVSHKGGQS